MDSLTNAMEAAEGQGRKGKKEGTEPVFASFVGAGGFLVEQITRDGRPAFAVWDGRGVTYAGRFEFGGTIYLPIDDDAIKEGAVLLPTGAEEYGEVKDLIRDVKAHAHRYLDVSESYENFAAWYILLTYVYDSVNTIPYLRALGDTGCGKSRFLDVIGRLCYKATLVSGCITPAPIYRLIRRWHGTIILDEADFRDSDEKNEVVTILNCGFEKGRPVIRCQKEDPDNLQYLPTFSPKIFSTRRVFKDKALESRCLTEIMRETSRTDIPYLLPPAFYEEEATLRNKLLMFRFRNLEKINPNNILGLDFGGDLEPRLKQATASFAVLFSNVDGVFEDFKRFLRERQEELVEERAGTLEGQVVVALFGLVRDPPKETTTLEVSAKDIAGDFTDADGKYKYTPAAIGRVLKGLGVETKNRRTGSGGVVKGIVWNPARMEVLRKRYIPVAAVAECSDCSERSGSSGDREDNQLRVVEELITVDNNKNLVHHPPTPKEPATAATTATPLPKKAEQILKIIQILAKEHGGDAWRQEIFKEAERRMGLSSLEAEDVLGDLERRGAIRETNPGSGYYVPTPEGRPA